MAGAVRFELIAFHSSLLIVPNLVGHLFVYVLRIQEQSPRRSWGGGRSAARSRRAS